MHIKVELLLESDLHREIKLTAAKHGMTLNQEIEKRLEESFLRSQPKNKINWSADFISVTREKTGDSSQITILIPLREG